MSNTGPFRLLLRDHARFRQILRILTDSDFHAKAVKPSPYGLGTARCLPFLFFCLSEKHRDMHSSLMLLLSACTADTVANEFKEKTNPIAAHAARDKGGACLSC